MFYVRNELTLIIFVLLSLGFWNQRLSGLNKEALRVHFHVSTESPTNVSRKQTDDHSIRNTFDVWDQYMQDHSHMALYKESQAKQDPGRKFAIGYYSCPLQAGNRLHHFMNSLIWAVITNRTLLWKYYDKETCLQVGMLYAPNICAAANHVEDCDKILERAEWLPSFDEWAPIYNLSSPLSLSYWTTHEKSTKHKLWYDGAEMEAGRADTTDSILVDFPQMLGQDSYILRRERRRKMLLTSTESQKRAEQMFGSGVDYLYGQLFHDSFAFQPTVSVPIIPESSLTRPSNATVNGTLEVLSGANHRSITVVVHSRHSNAADNGTNIVREARCLDQVLKGTGTTWFCQVMILSDRPQTLRAVKEYLQNHHSHCHALIAPHDKGFSFSIEHGPFSGSGFYQDLAMVSNQSFHVPTARTAFIGSKHRSSSQLIRELLTYQLERQARSRDSFINLTTCYLDDK